VRSRPAVARDHCLAPGRSLGAAGGVCDANGDCPDSRVAAGWPFLAQFVAHGIDGRLPESLVRLPVAITGALDDDACPRDELGLAEHGWSAETPVSLRAVDPGWRPALPAAAPDAFGIADLLRAPALVRC
jgi:hypothetical protein